MNIRMKKLLILGLLCISFLVVIISCSSIWTKSYDSRDAEISRLLSNVRPHQGNPDSHYLLACYYQERGRHKEAIEEFKKVLFIDPNYAKAYNGMGVSYDLLGEFSNAIGFYKQALKINPDMDYVHNNMGYSYLLQGNFDEAITAFRNAIDLNGQNIRFHNNLGLAYGEQGQYDLALAEFKLTGDEAKAHHSIAQIYFKKGLYDEAKNHYAIALKLNPSLTVVRTALKATDALVKVFEPNAGKAEPKQLMVPGSSKEAAKIEKLSAANQLASAEMKTTEGTNNNKPHLSSVQTPKKEVTFHNEQPTLKEVSLSYDNSKEDKEPVFTVEEARKVSEVKTIDPPPVAQANLSSPERRNLSTLQPKGPDLPLTRSKDEGLKIRPEPPMAIRPSEEGLGTVKPVKKAKEIVDVSLERKKDSITYSIVADGDIGDYKVFELDSPSRLVLDIWNIGNHYTTPGIWLDNPFIKVVRIGKYPDKMRFVFDSLNPQLPPYRVARIDPKLTVSFGNIDQPDEPKIHAKETSSSGKEVASVSTKIPFEPSHNGKLAIEISNGNGVNNMARMVGDYLKGKGFKVTRLTNADYFSYRDTKIFYKKEYRNAADQVAEQLSVSRNKEETEKFDRPDVKMRILIGKDLVPYKKSFENGKKS